MVAKLKWSSVAVFFYAAMIGVPILLMALTLAYALNLGAGIERIVLVLVAIGSIVYSGISISEVYVHGKD